MMCQVSTRPERIVKNDHDSNLVAKATARWTLEEIMAE